MWKYFIGQAKEVTPTNFSRIPPYLLVAALILVGLPSSSIQQSAAQAQAVCQSVSGLNRFGVNEVLGWPGLYPPKRLEQSLGVMADADIGWARTNWAWKDMQPQSGPFDYAHLDDVTRIAAEHHIQVLPILTAVPAWASNAPAEIKAKYGNLSPTDRYRPTNLDDWLQYIRNVVERYNGDGVGDAPGSPRMTYWEVWNEENIPDFWPPSPNPAEYLALLKSTYQTVKAADPTAKIVLGGLANAGINADGSNYLQSLYSLGAAPYFDVVSIHFYSSPANGIAPVQRAVDSVRAIVDAKGDKGKPLWLTEIGWSDTASTSISQDQIASFLQDVYTAPLPADIIFWYNFRNIFAHSPDPEHNFGLVNADFSPKPSYNTYKSLAESCVNKVASSS